MTVIFLFLKYLEIEDSLNLDILDVADPPVKKPKDTAKQHIFDTVEIENDLILVHMPWVEGHSNFSINFKLYLKRLQKILHHKKHFYELCVI